MTSKDPGMIAVRALKVPLHEREEFLRHQCDGDAQLRERVNDLLGAYDDSSVVTGKDSVTAKKSRPAVRRPKVRGPGTRIDNYRLLQQIGEGGFGIVYMAEQTRPVKRMVGAPLVETAGISNSLGSDIAVLGAWLNRIAHRASVEKRADSRAGLGKGGLRDHRFIDTCTAWRNSARGYQIQIPLRQQGL